MRYYVSALLVAVALAASAAPGQASPVQAVDFAAPGTAFADNNFFTLGYQFTTGASSLVATHLGYFDGGNAFAGGTATVGLWDSGGTLLATATVTGGDSLIGFFRYADIADVTLNPNSTYFVGGVTSTTAAAYTFDASGFTVDPRIVFNGDAWQSGTSLSFPDLTSGVSNGFFGANLQIDSVNTIPEPATLAVFGLMAVGGGWLARRQKAIPAA